jgi:hypothetical protein
MPVYIHIANIIVEKTKIEEKYEGGIKQFKEDYCIGEETFHQEDDELFSIVRQNLYYHDFHDLSNKGLHYDEVNDYSEDFVAAHRFGGLMWKTNWIDSNAVFAWHKSCDPSQIERAQEIGNMLYDDIVAAADRGEILLNTIRTKE